ncbi:MAG: hypothetical protein ACSHX2_09040 [Rubritalea sp.]
MQMQNALQMRPPVEKYQRQVANPVLLVFVYLLSFVGLGIIIGPILFFAKPLSRHHAAFVLLISLVVLGVSGLYYYENYARYDY